MYSLIFSVDRLRQRIPVGFLGKDSLQPFEWGWANPAGGMFTSLEDLAKVVSERNFTIAKNCC